MKWQLKQVIKETDHPFLNFYIVDYDVEKNGQTKNRKYFFASRNQNTENLRLTNIDSKRADAVLIGTYAIIDKSFYLLLNKEFRPAMNHIIYSFPAGLCDKEDSSIEETAIREAKEETGYELTDIEVIVPPSPTSEGLSDECNAVVIGRINSKGNNALEEFEDIEANLYSVRQIKELLNDPNVIFSNSARLLVLYLLEKFS